VFGLFAAYVLSRYDFNNAVIVTISLPTAIPTAVAGFALLLLWGKYGMIAMVFLKTSRSCSHLTPLFNKYFRYILLAFGVIKPVFDTMSRSLEEASATIGATRWQILALPCLVAGRNSFRCLLTFARAVGEFGSTILVSGNLAGRTQTATLYLCEIQRRTNRSRECDCDRARLTFFCNLQCAVFRARRLEFETQEA
jgi:sulfate transport system permease protein